MSNELVVIGVILAVVVLAAIISWVGRNGLLGELIAELVFHAVSALLG